jgi:hypothetical protein
MVEILRRIDGTLVALTLLLIGAIGYFLSELPPIAAAQAGKSDLQQEASRGDALSEPRTSELRTDAWETSGYGRGASERWGDQAQLVTDASPITTAALQPPAPRVFSHSNPLLEMASKSAPNALTVPLPQSSGMTVGRADKRAELQSPYAPRSKVGTQNPERVKSLTLSGARSSTARRSRASRPVGLQPERAKPDPTRVTGAFRETTRRAHSTTNRPDNQPPSTKAVAHIPPIPVRAPAARVIPPARRHKVRQATPSGREWAGRHVRRARLQGSNSYRQSLGRPPEAEPRKRVRRRINGYSPSLYQALRRSPGFFQGVSDGS